MSVKKILSLVSALVVYASAASNDSECAPYYFRTECHIQPLSSINFVQQKGTKLKACDGTQTCFEKGSEVSLKDMSEITLRRISSIDVFPNGTLQLNGKSHCALVEHSYIRNEKDIQLDSARIEVVFMSAIINNGQITIGPNSNLTVGQSSVVDVFEYGRLQLGENNTIDVIGSSKLNIFPHLFDSAEKQELLLKSNTQVYILDSSRVRIESGKFLLNDKAQVRIEGASTVIIINGYVEVTENSFLWITEKGSFVVGYNPPRNQTSSKTDKDKKNGGDANASMIIGKGNKDEGIKLEIQRSSLTIVEGAHCLLKKNFLIDDSNIIVDSTTKNEHFDCYSSKAELIAKTGKKP